MALDYKFPNERKANIFYLACKFNNRYGAGIVDKNSNRNLSFILRKMYFRCRLILLFIYLYFYIKNSFKFKHLYKNKIKSFGNGHKEERLMVFSHKKVLYVVKLKN